MIERPLWRLLLAYKNERMLAERPLTCGECYILLEYLAENLIHQPDVNHAQGLNKRVLEHLDACPDCYEFYKEQLRALESVSQAAEQAP